MEGTLPWDKGFGTELAMGKGCWAYNLTADIKPGFNVSHSPARIPRCHWGNLASLSSGFTQLATCLQGTCRVPEQVTQDHRLRLVLTCSTLVSLPSRSPSQSLAP